MHGNDLGSTPTEERSRESRLLREVASTGQLSIRTSGKSLAQSFAISIAVVAGVFAVAYATGAVDGIAFVFGVFVVPLFMVIFALILHRIYGGKFLLLDEGGLTTFEGQYIPWSDVEKADVFRGRRSAPAARILISESAWREYLSRCTPPGRLVNKLNVVMTGKRGIFLPADMELDQEEIASVINVFALRRTSDLL